MVKCFPCVINEKIYDWLSNIAHIIVQYWLTTVNLFGPEFSNLWAQYLNHMGGSRTADSRHVKKIQVSERMILLTVAQAGLPSDNEKNPCTPLKSNPWIPKKSVGK